MGRLAPGEERIGKLALDYIRDAGGRLVTQEELIRHPYGRYAVVYKHKGLVRRAIHDARNLLGDTPGERYQIATHCRRGWEWRPR